MSNVLTGLGVKILTISAQVFAWPIIICGINPSGQPMPVNVDASGNLITGISAAAFIAYLATLPTTDPHVNGSPWNNGGILTISAG